jgi:hypothetical protein
MFGTKEQSILKITASATIPITADLVEVDATGGAVTVTLYSPQGQWPGAMWAGNNQGGRVRVMKTDASGNAVTVVCLTPGTVFGTPTITAQYQSRLFDADGISRWYSFN